MSVTYYTASGQPAFNTVATVGLPVWEKVLPEPNEQIVFRQRFMQTAASYSPLALNTPYPSSTYVPAGVTFYLVSEENFNDERAGVFTWDRVYARVPSSWSEREEYAYTYPAFVAGIAFGSTFGATAITPSGANYSVSTTATGISAGDNVYFDLGFVRSSLTYRLTFLEPAVSATSGTEVTIRPLLPGSGAFSSVTGTVREGSKGRSEPETLIVGSRIIHDYALTSVTGLNSDLPAVPRFAPVNSSGNEVDTLSTGTATVPNSAMYEAMIAGGAEIVAEQAIRQRWLGNIYERITRLVPAQ
jgi:hypothetical protein